LEVPESKPVESDDASTHSLRKNLVGDELKRTRMEADLSNLTMMIEKKRAQSMLLD
jgi:hypothetical protein